MIKWLNWLHNKLSAWAAKSDDDGGFEEWLKSHELGVEVRRRGEIDERGRK